MSGTMRHNGKVYVRLSDACKAAGKSRWTLMRWVAAGKAKAVRVGREVWVCTDGHPRPSRHPGYRLDK